MKARKLTVALMAFASLVIPASPARSQGTAGEGQSFADAVVLCRGDRQAGMGLAIKFHERFFVCSSADVLVNNNRVEIVDLRGNALPYVQVLFARGADLVLFALRSSPPHALEPVDSDVGIGQALSLFAIAPTGLSTRTSGRIVGIQRTMAEVETTADHADVAFGSPVTLADSTALFGVMVGHADVLNRRNAAVVRLGALGPADFESIGQAAFAEQLAFLQNALDTNRAGRMLVENLQNELRHILSPRGTFDRRTLRHLRLNPNQYDLREIALQVREWEGIHDNRLLDPAKKLERLEERLKRMVSAVTRPFAPQQVADRYCFPIKARFKQAAADNSEVTNALSEFISDFNRTRTERGY